MPPKKIADKTAKEIVQVRFANTSNPQSSPDMIGKQAVLLISPINNLRCEGEHLEKMIHALLFTHYTRLIVVIADGLQAVNFVNSGKSKDEAANAAQELGNKYIAQNAKHLVKALGNYCQISPAELDVNKIVPDDLLAKINEAGRINLKNAAMERDKQTFQPTLEVLRWDQFIAKSPNYSKFQDAFDAILAADTAFQAQVESDAQSYVKKHGLAPEAKQQSLNYFIKEFGIIGPIIADLGIPYVLYPGESSTLPVALKLFYDIKNNSAKAELDHLHGFWQTSSTGKKQRVPLCPAFIKVSFDYGISPKILPVPTGGTPPQLSLCNINNIDNMVKHILEDEEASDDAKIYALLKLSKVQVDRRNKKNPRGSTVQSDSDSDNSTSVKSNHALSNSSPQTPPQTPPYISPRSIINSPPPKCIDDRQENVVAIPVENLLAIPKTCLVKNSMFNNTAATANQDQTVAENDASNEHLISSLLGFFKQPVCVATTILVIIAIIKSKSVNTIIYPELSTTLVR